MGSFVLVSLLCISFMFQKTNKKQSMHLRKLIIVCSNIKTAKTWGSSTCDRSSAIFCKYTI